MPRLGWPLTEGQPTQGRSHALRKTEQDLVPLGLVVVNDASSRRPERPRNRRCLTTGLPGSSNWRRPVLRFLSSKTGAHLQELQRANLSLQQLGTCAQRTVPAVHSHAEHRVCPRPLGGRTCRPVARSSRHSKVMGLGCHHQVRLSSADPKAGQNTESTKRPSGCPINATSRSAPQVIHWSPCIRHCQAESAPTPSSKI